MNKYEKMGIWLPAFGVAAPFLFGAIASIWHLVPDVIVVICSFAPPLLGFLALIAIPVLRHRNIIPKGSASVPIGITLAIVGLVEPLFY